MAVTFSEFASTIRVETAFTVLAVAKRLKAAGKDVIELEIGDSPFPTTKFAKQQAIAAIEADQSHYCPSDGLPAFREGAAAFVNEELELDITAENIVVAPGAKIFELLFCETFVNPDDGVLVFSPYFPTYLPNIARRGARMVTSDLKQENAFRPNLADVERFLEEDPSPKAIFLNSPHNPTGGIALEEDFKALANLIRGRDIAVFSDEPYQHMVWQGRHDTILAQPGMIDQCLAAYTFSKSYSMSGWRLGYSVSSPEVARVLGNLINSSLSCVPPIVQLAGIGGLTHDREERDHTMKMFRQKVEILVGRLRSMEGVECLDPGGTFYVFPSVKPICNQHGITSHGLALYLLEGADDQIGVACLGGECFGQAGGGFLRFSCAEPDERLEQAMDFFADACTRTDRIAAHLAKNPQHKLKKPYPA